MMEKEYVENRFGQKTVFSCRSNMVKTWTTERKSPMQICPLCKDLISRSETFENQVLRCSKERVTCGKCGKTFKKRAYLVKHEHTQHASEDSEPVCTINKPDNGGELDWEEDPDISVEADWEVSPNEEDQEDTTATEEKDASNERATDVVSPDLFVGRVIRKTTEPVPLVTPKKLRTEQVVEPELCVAAPAKASRMKSYNERSSVKREEPLTEKMTLILESNETFYENNLKSRK